MQFSACANTIWCERRSNWRSTWSFLFSSHWKSLPAYKSSLPLYSTGSYTCFHSDLFVNTQHRPATASHFTTKETLRIQPGLLYFLGRHSRLHQEQNLLISGVTLVCVTEEERPLLYYRFLQGSISQWTQRRLPSDSPTGYPNYSWQCGIWRSRSSAFQSPCSGLKSWSSWILCSSCVLCLAQR